MVVFFFFFFLCCKKGRLFNYFFSFYNENALFFSPCFFYDCYKMNELENPEKSKNKTVGRISRLFQKKPKKKNMTSSFSSMSLSDPALSKQNTFQSSSSISSSQKSITTDPIENRNLPKLPIHQTDTGKPDESPLFPPLF